VGCNLGKLRRSSSKVQPVTGSHCKGDSLGDDGIMDYASGCCYESHIHLNMSFLPLLREKKRLRAEKKVGKTEWS